MIPNTKISQTILEFGKALIQELPASYSKAEFEALMSTLVTVWNTVTIDAWHNNRDNEVMLLQSIEPLPKEIKLKIKRLITRKKKHFSHDLRGVGNYWVRENNGELVFGCDARLNIGDIPLDSQLH